MISMAGARGDFLKTWECFIQGSGTVEGSTNFGASCVAETPVIHGDI